MSTAAKRYAKALFEFSRDAGRLDALRADFTALRELYHESDDFARFIDDPTLPPDRRSAALDKLFKKRADKQTLRFLKFLDHRGRLDLLDEIARRFVDLCNQHQGILPVEISSAAPLGEDQLARIIERLQARYDQTVEAEVGVDPAMIGGFRIRVGDTIHDYSVATRLHELQHQLLNAQ